MNPKVKLTAYAVLLILAAWFGWGFYSNYSAVAQAAKEAALAATADEPAPAPSTDSNSPPSTNAVTNAAQETTNPPGGMTNAAPIAAVSSNEPTAVSSNEAAATPVKKQAAHKKAPARKKVRKPVVLRDEGAIRGTMIRYLAALIGSLIGLGLLITHDVTHFVGSQAANYLFYDVADVVRDPEYERAEAVWANGQFLEAVQILRDFLKHHPRELHAALRIAEIYEKDLGNNLAAALEYEEVLKHKLPPERWGWAAIHLCNLYYRLGQQPKALALLHRVVEDYPRTGAAKKARARLGLPELVEEPAEEAMVEEVAEEENPVIQIDAPVAEPPPPPPPQPPKSNLPPGFRPLE
ncbi:MAG: tetratricopeptide repeat protein [Verrucomicrobiota bacterium]|jgi:TolA-binding protein